MKTYAVKVGATVDDYLAALAERKQRVIGLLLLGFDTVPNVGDAPNGYAQYAARLDDMHPFWWRCNQDFMAPGLVEQARLRLNPPADLGPELFFPYYDQINMCECMICSRCSIEGNSHEYRVYGRQDRHRECATALLAQLHAGTHVHMTIGQRAALARAEKEQRLIRAREAGASDATLAAIERGYVTVKMSDFYTTGCGIGIGPRIESAGRTLRK